MKPGIQGLERTVALKFLSPMLCQDEQARKRFLGEAKAISQLDNANVCTIFDMGETEDGQLYFAMPFYKGRELDEILRDEEVSLATVVDIMIQTCQGIHAAHKKGIVHRDIKPANIYVTEEGTAKVLDFGIAKLTGVELTQTGQRVGTILYMSPEQINSDPIDHRTDIWSLGVLFYEVLTGKRPFSGKTAIAISREILDCTPEPIHLHLKEAPPHVENIIANTLKVRPSERYDDLSEMIKDLKKIQREIEDGDFKEVTIVTKRPSFAGMTTDSTRLTGTLLEISKQLETFVGDSASTFS